VGDSGVERHYGRKYGTRDGREGVVGDSGVERHCGQKQRTGGSGGGGD